MSDQSNFSEELSETFIDWVYDNQLECEKCGKIGVKSWEDYPHKVQYWCEECGHIWADKEFFSPVFRNNPLDAYEEMGLFDEGVATDSKSAIITALNQAAEQLVQFSKNYGYKSDRVRFYRINDINTNLKAAVIDIQIGMTNSFPSSEVVKIEVYDTDNITVMITDNVARAFSVQRENSFDSVDKAARFLGEIYNRI